MVWIIANDCVNTIGEGHDDDDDDNDDNDGDDGDVQS